jgi:hypothetical protein
MERLARREKDSAPLEIIELGRRGVAKILRNGDQNKRGLIKMLGIARPDELAFGDLESSA